MGREQFLHRTGLGAGTAGNHLQLLEGHRHSPRVLSGRLQEFVAVIVGLALLFLGVLGVQDGISDGTELGVGEDRGGLAGGGQPFEGGARQELRAHLFLGVLEGDMADLMADDPKQFVVRHDVHDPGIDPDAAVGAGERIDLLLLINLEVQRNAVHGIQSLREVAEPLRVGVAFRQDPALGIKLGNVLMDIGLYLFVGKGQGLSGNHSALEGAGRVERFGAGDEQQRAGCKSKESFHHTANIKQIYEELIIFVDVKRKRRMKIIIEGAGQVGSHLAKMLSHEGGDITVIDDNEGRLQKLSSTADVVTIVGDPSSVRVLRDAGCTRADLFIAVNPSTTQAVNIVSALLAKRLGSKRVIARIEDEAYLLPENKLMFKDMGIDMLFYPEKIASDEIIDLLKHTASTDSMDFARGKLQLVVFRLDDDSPILDMNVAEFTAAMEATSAQAQLRIIAIARKGETIIPKFDTKFNYNDHLYIIAKREGVPTIMKFLGKDNIEVNKVMILGGSEIGEMVAAQLSSQQLEAVKLIEIDKDRCRELSEKLPSDVIVANGDCRNSDFLVEEGVREYDALVAVTGNDEANILACVVAKKFGVARTIAQVENLEYVRLAEDMGVDAVINKKLITAGRIFKFTLSDKVRFVRYMSGTDAEVLEYTAAPNSKVTKGALKDIGFPRNAIIGGVIRGSESFIAVGDTRIEPYDRVAVFALPETVKEVDRFFK